MRITATFSDGLQRQLDGCAIGDEIVITAKARIVGADEALMEVTAFGDGDPRFLQGELDVRLLLSNAQVVA